VTGKGSEFPYSARVLQAQGMVSVQARCGMARAIILMTDKAEATSTTIDELAQQVLERSVRFDQ
jgi:hypothetical protein